MTKSRRAQHRPSRPSALPRTLRPADPGRPRSRDARRAADRQTPLLIGAGIVVVAAAAVGALLLSGTGGPSPVASATTGRAAAATVSGAALPAFIATSGDPGVGLPIPEAAGTSFDGAPVRIEADGRPKILLFLAHWCPHCQAEVPVVRDWLNGGGLPAEVDLLSIATSIDPARPNYPPDAWLDREGWQVPVLVDEKNAVANAYGLGSFPYWVAVGADGAVSMRLTGELTFDQLDALAGSLQ